MFREVNFSTFDFWLAFDFVGPSFFFSENTSVVCKQTRFLGHMGMLK